MIPKKYKLLIQESESTKLYFLFFSSLLVVFFELLGIGIVPFFALSLTDTDNTLNKISTVLNVDINFDLKKNTLILFSGIIFISIFIIKNAVIGFTTYLQAKIFRTFRINTTSNLYEHLLKSPYIFFLNTNPAKVIRAVNHDVNYAYTYLSAKIKLLRESLIIILVLVFLIVVDPSIYIASFSFFLIFTIIFNFFYKKFIKPKGVLYQSKVEERLKFLNQSFYSIKEIILNDREKFFKKSFNKINYILEDMTFITSFVGTLPRLVFEVIAVISIIFFSSLLVILGKPDSVIIPSVALMVVSGARFIPGFNAINQSLSMLKFAKPSFDTVVRSLFEFETAKNKIIKKDEIIKIDLNKDIKINFNKNIILNKINFNFKEKKVINELSLEIKKGDIIGIIGFSGEGKSTLMNIFTGLLQPDSGKIFVDGTDINENLRMWQKKIGYISQDTYLLDDNIRENICFGFDETEIKNDRLQKVLKEAQLDSFVQSLPDKELTVIGNFGSRISGGQRQRIAIARALYTNPELLILDEATSSLDLTNEEKIIEEMQQYKTDKTIIIVSHRKNALKYCDKIYILKDGMLKESTNYENLDKVNYSI
jgi:ABC-type multidrug transport system fused ATPase/permease subunit